MFGRHYESMYRGSMVGSGALMFAVWGYVIAHMRPDEKVGTQVELNAKLIGPILGEKVEDVQATIEKLCHPDPESRSKEEGGARLVRLGQFDYQVVNGKKYREIRDEEARREQNRLAQQRYREKEKEEKALKRLKKGKPLPGETSAVKLYEMGINDQDGQPIPPPEEPNDEDEGTAVDQ